MSGHERWRAASRRIVAMTVVFSLGGCGRNPPPAEPAPADRALLESVQRPLQRAHDAEEISAERKAELDRKLEQAE